MHDGLYTIAKTATLGMTVAAYYFDPKCSKSTKVLVAVTAAAITVFRLYNEFLNQGEAQNQRRFTIDIAQFFGQLVVGGPFDPILQDFGPSSGGAQLHSREGAGFAPCIQILLGAIHCRV